MTGGQHLLKSVWHLVLAGAATFEAVTAETRLRKLFAAAAAGWHIEAARDDFKDFREARKYAGNT
jgi:hypothetical protein